MRRNATSAAGALHPVLFFAIVYAISLFLALFVCSTIYDSFNGSAAVTEAQAAAKPQMELHQTTAVTAYR